VDRLLKYPIDKYRALVYTHALYLYTNMSEKTPQCFSEVFGKRRESDHQRLITDYNWKSSIAGNQLPSQATVERTHLVCPKATHYYDSPLWKALRTPNQTEHFWQSLLGSLQPKIYRVVSEGKLTSKKTLKNPLLAISPYKFFRIFQSLDDQSLAVLIAAIRIETTLPMPTPQFYELLEFLIVINLRVLLSEEPYYEYRYEIYSFIKDHILKPHENELANKKLWAATRKSFDLENKQMNAYVERAKELGIVMSRKDKAEFLYYFYSSEQFMAAWELAMGNVIYPFDSPPNNRGLAWIIEQINENRTPNEQIKPLFQAVHTGSDEQFKTASFFNFSGVTT
jgi:hypothetical protein